MLGLVGLTLLVAACEKKESPTDGAARPAASIDKVQALDPDLAQAVAQASARAPRGAAPNQEGGPPARGIFGPGAADKELPRGQPAKLTLGGQGSEPRVPLAPPALKPGLKQTGSIQVIQQSEGGGLPVEFGVAFEVPKPKTEAKPVDGAAAPIGVPVELRITSARLSVVGAPREIEEKVAKLKGAKISYELLPNGAGNAFRYELPKGADVELGDVVRSLTDVVSVITLPRPEQPLGVGGFWMVTSRDETLGQDLVTYRLVKVTRIDGVKVSLSVNTKRYSASPSFDWPGLPPDAPRGLAEFQALAEGTLELDATKPLPFGGSQNSVMAATLGDAQKPRGAGTVEIRTRAELKL